MSTNFEIIHQGPVPLFVGWNYMDDSDDELDELDTQGFVSEEPGITRAATTFDIASSGKTGAITPPSTSGPTFDPSQTFANVMHTTIAGGYTSLSDPEITELAVLEAEEASLNRAIAQICQREKATREAYHAQQVYEYKLAYGEPAALDAEIAREELLSADNQRYGRDEVLILAKRINERRERKHKKWRAASQAPGLSTIYEDESFMSPKTDLDLPISYVDLPIGTWKTPSVVTLELELTSDLELRPASRQGDALPSGRGIDAGETGICFGSESVSCSKHQNEVIEMYNDAVLDSFDYNAVNFNHTSPAIEDSKQTTPDRDTPSESISCSNDFATVPNMEKEECSTNEMVVDKDTDSGIGNVSTQKHHSSLTKLADESDQTKAFDTATATTITSHELPAMKHDPRIVDTYPQDGTDGVAFKPRTTSFQSSTGRKASVSSMQKLRYFLGGNFDELFAPLKSWGNKRGKDFLTRLLK